MFILVENELIIIMYVKKHVNKVPAFVIITPRNCHSSSYMSQLFVIQHKLLRTSLEKSCCMSLFVVIVATEV